MFSSRSTRKIAIGSAALFMLVLSTCAVSVHTEPNELEITKTADPTTIKIDAGGTCLYPETTTITIGVTGYGGTIEDALPIDVVFAIDSSGSMSWNDPGDLRLAAAKSFVDKLYPTRDQGGVVSWDHLIDFTFGLTYDLTTLKNKIDLVNSAGGTNLDLGLAASIAMLDANTRFGTSVEVIIFLSDGAGIYTPSGSPLSKADEAASKGYVIYSIGLKMTPSSPAEMNLIDMADATGGKYYSSPTAENLQAIFDDIFTTIIISTAPSDVNVFELTQSYIVNEGDFSIAPDFVFDVGGKTLIIWLDVARYVGDEEDPLAADETFTVTFTAGSSKGGENLPVDFEPGAIVSCLDPEGDPQIADIPQAYIKVILCVGIDIKPGSFPNAINPKGKGVIPVAVLSNEDFDARTIIHSTVRFGPGEAEPVHKNYCGHVEDVDGDGDLDVVYHFNTQDTGIEKGDTEATLTGETTDGAPIEGSDSVKTVGGKP